MSEQYIYEVHYCDGNDFVDSVWSNEKDAMLRLRDIVNELIAKEWYGPLESEPGEDYILYYNEGDPFAVFQYGKDEEITIVIQGIRIDDFDHLPVYFEIGPKFRGDEF